MSDVRVRGIEPEVVEPGSMEARAAAFAGLYSVMRRMADEADALISSFPTTPTGSSQATQMRADIMRRCAGIRRRQQRRGK